MDAPGLLAQVGARLDDATRRLVEADADFARRVSEACREIGERWPQVAANDATAFAEHLATRIAAEANLSTALPRLRVGDLFLTWWAARGEPRALAAFEAAHAGILAQLEKRFHRLPADELRQRLRIRLFVGDGAQRPRIAEYSGFGFLENWLRVTAMRMFIDIARSERRRALEDELDDADLFGLAAAGADPAMAPFREQLRVAVKRAFTTAVARLTPRERNFLRHAHVDKLTLDQIAGLYQVHRATVARTLAAARAGIIEGTRTAVVGELGIGADELDSAVRLLDSRFELSLSRVLGSGTHGAIGTPPTGKP